jgi:hypothetical protein
VISPTQRPLPDNSQHSQETDTHAPGGIRTQNPSKRAPADPRLRSHGLWDRPITTLATTNPKRTGLRSHSGLRGEKPATNCHCYGTGPKVGNKNVPVRNYGAGVELSPAVFGREMACDLYILAQHTTCVNVVFFRPRKITLLSGCRELQMNQRGEAREIQRVTDGNDMCT